MELVNLFAKLKHKFGDIYEDTPVRRNQSAIIKNEISDEKNHDIKNSCVTNPINNKKTKENLNIQNIIQKLSEQINIDPHKLDKYLTDLVKFQTENNRELMLSRIKILSQITPNSINTLLPILKISVKNPEQGVFLLDNLIKINDIFIKKHISSLERYNLLTSINKFNYCDFLNASNNNHLGSKFVTNFIYNTKTHNIGYGNDSVIVDSSEIISLLSGVNSISFSKTGNQKQFDETIKKLIAKEDTMTDTHYGQIVEAILTQKPELAGIAKIYQDLDSKCRTWLDDYEDVIKKQEQFFKDLNCKGILPKEITLRTVIPDKNAFLEPWNTLEVFLSRT